MNKECRFCNQEIRQGKIIYRTEDYYILVPTVPVVSGHVMLIPQVHVTDFADDPEITSMIMREASLYASYMGGDFNLITSKGESATQTVMHLHVHLVPRTREDSLRIPWGKENQLTGS